MKKIEPQKVNRKFKPIDNEKEHNRVLYDLGHLDDMEDWELYQEQEKKLETEVDIDTYRKYCPPKGK